MLIYNTVAYLVLAYIIAVAQNYKKLVNAAKLTSFTLTAMMIKPSIFFFF